jgi:endoglucanase
MRYFAVTAALMIVGACAAQNTPTPGPDEEDMVDGGSSGSSAGGNTSSGGSLPKSGSNSGGTASGGKPSNGGKTSTAGTSSGGDGAAGEANGGAGGDASPTGGSGGKGGSGGSAGKGGNAGAGGGSGGAGCQPTASTPLAGISARYQSEQPSSSTFSIGSQLAIANAGPNTLNLTDLKLRYYFTNEVTAPLVTTVNWSYFRPNGGGAQTTIDKSKVTLEVVPMTCTTAKANAYIEFTFAADVGSLTPGNQVYFSWVATNTASQKFTQSNDYSFDGAAKVDADDSKLVVLQNSGNRVWGSEP